MSIFGTIMSKIFGTDHADAAPSGGAATPADKGASPAPSDGTTAPSGPSKGDETPTPPAAQQDAPTTQEAPAAAPPTAPSTVDVAAVLDGMEENAGQKLELDWRHSIVDLMKLLHMDSSLSARKELAHELQYSGDTNDSATMNMWLHKEVMKKLAENGGKLPPDMH